VALGVEVAEFVDAGERHVQIGVVHHRGALEVAGVGKHLLFEVDGAPAQIALGVIEVAIDRTGVDDRHRADDLRLRVLVRIVEEIGFGEHGDQRVVGHAGQPGAVAIGGQTLIGVVEVAVVVRVAHRKAADDGRRQVLRFGLPLLGGVVHEEGLVQRTPDQRDALLDEVRRFLVAQFLRLLLDQLLCLIRAVGRGEELVDGAQVDRHREHDALVGGVHVVLVVGESRELVDVVPDLLVRGVEQMGPIAVHLDAGDRFGLRPGIATDMAASFDDDDTLAQVVSYSFGNRETE